jgi:hypothetical protein
VESCAQRRAIFRRGRCSQDRRVSGTRVFRTGLGPAAFGEFALVYTAAQITALLADLGLTSLVLRQGARSAGVQRVSFWTALTLNVAASLACALGLVAAFALIHGTGTATAAIYSPTLVLLTVTTSLEIAAIAAQRPVRAAASRFAGNVCALQVDDRAAQIQSPEAVAAHSSAAGSSNSSSSRVRRARSYSDSECGRVIVPLLRRALLSTLRHRHLPANGWMSSCSNVAGVSVAEKLRRDLPRP